MRFGSRLAALALALSGCAVLANAGEARAQPAPTRIIYSFPAKAMPNRFYSLASFALVADAAGYLYGVTGVGGPPEACLPFGCGTIFRLVRPAAKGLPWTEQTLYDLGDSSGTDGSGPPLLDAAGNLYGTAYANGAVGGKPGKGTVWKLSPPAAAGGAWTLATLHVFSGGVMGAGPQFGLVMDHSGVLYGIAGSGGAYDHGAVFSLTPPSPGGTTWTETVLHSFDSKALTYPNGPLALSPDQSSLFGDYGGSMIYRLRRTGGTWKYSRVYEFSDRFFHPQSLGKLLIDRNENLFGTVIGGAYGHGAVFELSPPAPGQSTWTEQVLHSFSGPDGARPIAGVIARGLPQSLFGATARGGEGGAIDGSSGDFGVVFRLDPPASGSGPWAYTVLHAFAAGRRDTGGAGDIAQGLTFGPDRLLFGVAAFGGRNGTGAVFSQSPE